jgi:hypothetical protein
LYAGELAGVVDLSDNLCQVASEPATVRESLVARYRRWNRDRAIEWAMTGAKKPTDGAGGSDTKGAAVLQKLVREVGIGSSYPTLTKSNYSDWARLMKVKLKARRLWQAVNDGDGSDVDDQEDMMALDALCTAVPPELARAICDKETSKEAWDTIATMRVGDKRVKENSAQKLRRDFELAAFKEGETVEDFALRLTGMQASLQTLGEELEDKQIVLKMMQSVPAKYQQMVVAIRTLMDSPRSRWRT